LIKGLEILGFAGTESEGNVQQMGNHKNTNGSKTRRYDNTAA